MTRKAWLVALAIAAGAVSAGTCGAGSEPPADAPRRTDAGIASRTEISATVDGLNLYGTGELRPGTWFVYPTDPTKCAFGWLDEATGSNQEFGPFRADEHVIGFTLPPGANVSFHMMRECDHARQE